MKVYPLHEIALRAYSGTTRSGHKLGHPTNGDLRVEGSDWPHDGFTYRAMRDGDITEDENAGWRPESPTAPAMTETGPAKKPKLDVSGV
jgi:hypothetical protein